MFERTCLPHFPSSFFNLTLFLPSSPFHFPILFPPICSLPFFLSFFFALLPFLRAQSLHFIFVIQFIFLPVPVFTLFLPFLKRLLVFFLYVESTYVEGTYVESTYAYVLFLNCPAPPLPSPVHPSPYRDNDFARADSFLSISIS